MIRKANFNQPFSASIGKGFANPVTAIMTQQNETRAASLADGEVCSPIMHGEAFSCSRPKNDVALVTGLLVFEGAGLFRQKNLECEYQFD